MIKILKLGGSIITNKKEPFSIKWENIERIAKEIKDYKGKLIIIHGGGSFGHPVAKKHINNLKGGFWEIQRAMRRLNNIIINTLNFNNIPAVSIQPSSFAYIKNNKLYFDISAIKLFLDNGFIPVAHGDIIIGDRIKILSGDEIATYLAKELNGEILFATNVDGVYINNEVIEKIDNKNYLNIIEYLSGSDGIDITGGMRYKIETLKKYKLKAIIFNGNKEGNIKNALFGNVKGTKIDFTDNHGTKK